MTQRTPLNALCLKQGARMIEFSGWEMPVQFTGIRQEHEAVRHRAGVFDISHMGKFILTGAKVIDELQRLVPTDLSKLRAGKAQYTVLLNPQGGIIDDLIVYHQGKSDEGKPDTSEQVTLIVNAGTTPKDKAWLQQQLSPAISFNDVSQAQALIAIQGPLAVEKLQALCPQENLSAIGRYQHHRGTLLGDRAFFARTGYTGEDGFEVMLPAHLAPQLWQQLMALEVEPCGLGARDTLRLEAAMALYGQDIDETTSPLEAGLGWLVHLDKPMDFIGRAILSQQKAEGVERKLVGLALSDRNIARHGYPVFSGEQPVGEITSGTLSPTLGYPIALAYVRADFAKVGQTLEVAIRQKRYSATVIKRPFYKATAVSTQ